MAYHPHRRKIAKEKPWLDLVVSAVAIVSPAMTLPQVALIYSSKNAQGVSTISWMAYALMSVVWLLYGLKRKETPIVVNSIVGGCLSFLVALGSILYA